MKTKLDLIRECYGFEAQLIKLAEECAEFSAAIHKRHYYERLVEESGDRGLDPMVMHGEHRAAEEKVWEELTDVLIAADHIQSFYMKMPWLRDTIASHWEHKVNRQLKRMEEEKAK